ncbi:MAG: leucine-rich repeat protein, partial [Clostridia bacterium]|nr:leucine-rich repeat protein [Clostridia bacterium]
SKLVFADGDVFRNENHELVELPEQTPADKRFPNYDQLSRECRGVVALSYIPDKVPGAWRCACGQMSLEGEASCVACHVALEWLDTHFDADHLEKAAEEYEKTRYEAKCAPIYEAALNPEKTVAGYREAANKLWTISDYKDAQKIAENYTKIADEMAKELREKEEKEKEEKLLAEKEAEYQRMKALYDAAKPTEESEAAYLKASAEMKKLSGFEDSAKLAKVYQNKAKQIVRNEIKATPKDERESRYTREEYIAHLEKVAYWKRNIIITLICFAIVAVMSVSYYFFIHAPMEKNNTYENAVNLAESGNVRGYCEAAVIFRSLGDYKDCEEQLKQLSLKITDGERDDAYLSTIDEMYYLTIVDRNTGKITYNTDGYTVKEHLVIPDYLDGMAVKEIEENALSGSKELLSLTLPKTLVTIGSGAFSRCVNLKEVNLGDTNVYSIGQSAFSGCTSLVSIELPDRTREVGASCFDGCTSLKEVKLSNGMSEIPASMFNKCVSLSKVVYPSKVKTIGDNAFYQCSALKSAALPATVRVIGGYAFYKCTSIEYVDLYSTMETVSIYAFDVCTSLKTVNYYGTEEEFKKIFVDRNNDAFMNAS